MSKKTSQTEDRLLDLAESLIRKNGYNGFSFRELAAGIGVKSSSVHYYFPTKAHLGAKVARRYTDRFVALLEKNLASAGPGLTADAILDRLHALFRKALTEDGQMCLCGVLAAEAAGLPEEVAMETRTFFSRLSQCLEDALAQTTWGQGQSAQARRGAALKALALYEGALLVARLNGSTELFDLIEADRLEA
ncbi:TetR/AcrR family transcriptional regulator [Labrenzia sp. CE80]|uniref:TetR/AcrR family transcriptional regulator n=1 Tax=Labrenzia sp. CE80 TaxID=1788986 RepID=UPI00129AD053|nr:TetR/AcrR family transcriptional regulator [Labrenzia sp. CE80]